LRDDVTGGAHRTKTTHTREHPSYGQRQYQQQCIRRRIVIINYYFGQRRSLRHGSLLATFGGVRVDWSPSLWLLMLLLLSSIMVQARQRRYHLNETRRERNPRLHPTYDAPMIDATTRQQYHYFFFS